jgi:hypothetical protein
VGLLNESILPYVMVLVGAVGRGADKRILFYAARNTPSLIIDCANKANPHMLFPEIDIEQMANIYVIELELLYKYRDVLKYVPYFIKKNNIKTTVITSSKHLFHYQDEKENENVKQHAWELIKDIARYNEVIVSADIDTARKYCDQIWDMEDNKTGSMKKI